MAVSQVEALKNPCRAWWWRWNSLVAAQPPSSAPATPIRQVMMRPCDLLPGISMLAIRPAPRPRTIQAMMPITGSLVSPQVEYAVVGHAGDRGGRRVSRGCSPSFSRSVLPAPVRVRIKNPGPAAARAILAGDGCLGPERCLYTTLPWLSGIGIPQPITSSSNLRAAGSGGRATLALAQAAMLRPGQCRPAPGSGERQDEHQHQQRDQLWP